MSEREDHDIVYRQPVDDRQRAQCYDAMLNCPVEAIGDDG